ncbi:MAG: hypothetical protein RR630_01140 [Coprobacillus sp.]
MQNKQDKSERAKIFLSFDALKGFREYLKCKERIVVDKKLLSQDRCYELDWQIHQVEVGKMIKIVYYDKEEYVSKEGMVTKLDLELGKIRIVDQVINVKDIIEIQGENDDINTLFR